MCATSRMCRQLKIIHNVEVKFQNLLIGENKEVKNKLYKWLKLLKNCLINKKKHHIYSIQVLLILTIPVTFL
jgi:hypothetical protein